jgi:4-amino-4-deoxy-L-arabinose transferase and related glycosyltransferases of PMT family
MKNNRQIIIFLFIFLAILPILIFRDYTANNELKYLSIVDEAIEEGHIFAFYNHGVPYADKPPLYFWIMMIGKFIFGKHIMFCISLLSVIPALVVLYTMNSWLYKYYDEREYNLPSWRANISLITNTGTLLLSTTAFL